MCFENHVDLDMIDLLKGVSTGGPLNRQRSINKYYENPNYCKECKSVIKVRCKEKVSETKRKTFCCRSCSVKFNNRGLNRNKGKGSLEKVCPVCNGRKRKNSEMCRSCYDDRLSRKTLEEVKRDEYPNWNKVRSHARVVMIKSGIEKTCSLCNHSDFDSVVEVCHIKAITCFDENELVSVVNHPNNLIYLCPSHHRLFDKGLINITPP